MCIYAYIYTPNIFKHIYINRCVHLFIIWIMHTDFRKGKWNNGRTKSLFEKACRKFHEISSWVHRCCWISMFSVWNLISELWSKTWISTCQKFKMDTSQFAWNKKNNNNAETFVCLSCGMCVCRAGTTVWWMCRRARWRWRGWPVQVVESPARPRSGTPCGWRPRYLAHAPTFSLHCRTEHWAFYLLFFCLNTKKRF